MASSIEKAKIAVFTGVGEPDYVCGASRSVFMIFNRIKYPFIAVMEGPGGITKEYESAGVETVVLRSPATVLKGFRYFSIFRKLRFLASVIAYTWSVWLFLIKKRIKVVYTTNMTAYFVVVPARLAGCKVVVAIRGSLKESIKTWFLLKFCNKFLLLSKEEMNRVKIWYRKFGEKVLDEKLGVIYNGTDVSAAVGLNQIESRGFFFGSSEGTISILYVAAFRRAKNQKEFIDLVIPAILKETKVKVQFAFLGGATSDDDLLYLEECKEMVAFRGQAVFVHFVDYVDSVGEWYSNADIVVLASKNEGMPRCVVESLAFARPVVCYNVSSVQEIVAVPNAGFVVSQGDSRAMAEKLLFLIENEADRLEMGRRGRMFAVENLDIEVVSKQHEQLLMSLL